MRGFLSVFCLVLSGWMVRYPAAHAQNAPAVPSITSQQSVLQSICDPAGAIPAYIQSIADDGTVVLSDNIRLRLANILWPDHLEPKSRLALIDTLRNALRDQKISWKAVLGPDRWGITPANLFISEPDGVDPPFWLQAGLVEKGLVPVWPDQPGACLAALEVYERDAIHAHRGYWAPRAQSARHRLIDADRDAHTGRKLAAIWHIKDVRAWRNLHFVNFRSMGRTGPSLSLTSKLVSQLTQAGDAPAHWQGKRLLARVILSPQGTARLRAESIDHLRRLDDGAP